MAARTGVLLPKALHDERRKFGRTTLFDYASRRKISFAFEVRELPVVVKLFGATEGQRVYVLSSFGIGSAEKLERFSPNGEPVFLDAGRNSFVLRQAGKYRLELDGEPGTCTVTYEPQMTAEEDPEIPQPSGVQGQNGNLLRADKKTDIIEVFDRPWAFTAYGLTGSEHIEVWTTYGWGGSFREEPYLINDAPVWLTPTYNSIKLDVTGRYRFKLVGTLDNKVLTGNPTAYTASESGGGDPVPGPPGPPGPQGEPGQAATGFEYVQETPATQWVVNHNLGYKPSVELRTVGGMEFDADVIHMSTNQFIVSAKIPVAGTARYI